MAVLFGPNTYTETDARNAVGSPGTTLVKAITIDFSTMPSTAGVLSLVFLAGQIGFGELGGLRIYVGGTPTGQDGTLIWSQDLDGGNGIFGDFWFDISIWVPGVFPISNFTNPNPAGNSYLKFFAIDDGNGITGFRNFTIEIDGPSATPSTCVSGWGIEGWGGTAGGAGGTAPQVINVNPTTGTLLSSAQQQIEFDVIDISELMRRIIVYVAYPNNDIVEVIHTGDVYCPKFVALSTRTVITNGFHYKVIRNGGWPDTSITITVDAISISGEED